MDCDQVRELLEAYALDALEESERIEVEAHLATCPDCQRLANEYAKIAALLPAALAAASSARPPARLRASLREAAVAMRDGPQAGIPTNGKTSISRRANPPQAITLVISPRLRLIAIAVAVFVLVLLIALGTGFTVVLAREQALRSELTNLTGQQELVLEVIDSPKAVKAVLRPPTGSNSKAYGKLFSRPDMSDVVAMAARLPQPPARQAYHLWVTDAGQTRLAGVLVINDQGFGLLSFKADHVGPTYESAQLTLQAIGTTSPVGPVILAWDMQH